MSLVVFPAYWNQRTFNAIHLYDPCPLPPYVLGIHIKPAESPKSTLSSGIESQD